VETTERIVEAYVRYVKGWATIPNIHAKGQYEIDLLAIDPVALTRYHIESGVSVAAGFSKLTVKPFSAEALKQRAKAAQQRRTIDFFLERKFGNPDVLETLRKYGFKEGEYTRVIVSWGWTVGAAEKASEHGVELWDFRGLMREITEALKGKRSYVADDTLRTLHLYSLATDGI
jgi:hypothetical protein